MFAKIFGIILVLVIIFFIFNKPKSVATPSVTKAVSIPPLLKPQSPLLKPQSPLLKPQSALLPRAQSALPPMIKPQSDILPNIIVSDTTPSNKILPVKQSMTIPSMITTSEIPPLEMTIPSMTTQPMLMTTQPVSTKMTQPITMAAMTTQSMTMPSMITTSEIPPLEMTIPSITTQSMTIPVKTTTRIPLTMPPITMPPSTMPPSTMPPITMPPITMPPSTMAPITMPPITMPPITMPPITMPPITVSALTTTSRIPLTMTPLIPIVTTIMSILPPSNVVAVGGNALVVVTWNRSVNATSYYYTYSTNPTYSSALSLYPLDDVDTVTISGLVNGVTYYVWIMGSINGRMSQPIISNAVIPSVPIIQPPTNVVAVVGVNNTITVTWGSSSTPNITGYKYSIKTIPDTTTTTIGYTLAPLRNINGNLNTVTIDDIIDNTTYYVEVSAVKRDNDNYFESILVKSNNVIQIKELMGIKFGPGFKFSDANSVYNNYDLCATSPSTDAGVLTTQLCINSQNYTRSEFTKQIINIANPNMCISTSGTSPGKQLIQTECNSDTKQQWIFDSDNRLQQVASNLCANSWNGFTITGGKTALYACEDGANSKFIKPVTSA